MKASTKFIQNSEFRIQNSEFGIQNSELWIVTEMKKWAIWAVVVNSPNYSHNYSE